MNPPENDKRQVAQHLMLIVAISGLARLMMAVVFPVLVASDSLGYIEMGRMISQWDFSAYNGGRTPLYPLLILAAGFDNGRVVLIQHLMGILTAVWIYFIFFRIAGRRNWALVVALVSGLNPGMILIERWILTESMTTLFLVATTIVLLRALENPNSRRVWLIAAGSVSGLATLARPALIYLPVLLGALVLWTGRKESGDSILKNIAAAVLPGLLLILLWSGFNYRHTGFFSPSTLGGFALINHAGAFIEDAPPEYEQIKRIYLTHRASQVASYGHQRNTIWASSQELMDSTGMNYQELGNTMKRLSIALIWRNPVKYCASAGKAFVLFWRAAWYSVHGGFAAALANGSIPMNFLIIVFLLSHTFLTALFFALPVIWWKWHEIRTHLEPNISWLSLYAIVLTGAVLQALAIAGENPRYGIPFEPLILPAGAMALLALNSTIRSKLARESAGAS